MMHCDVIDECPQLKRDIVDVERKKRGEVWRRHNELKTELELVQFDIEALEHQVKELKHRNEELETMRRLIIKAVKPSAVDFFTPVTDAFKRFGKALHNTIFPRYAEILDED
jgi:predicted nuclease with TOPRIM domain